MKAQELLTYVEELVFKTSMFGYDKDEVDNQLDKICDEIEALKKGQTIYVSREAAPEQEGAQEEAEGKTEIWMPEDGDGTEQELREQIAQLTRKLQEAEANAAKAEKLAEEAEDRAATAEKKAAAAEGRAAVARTKAMAEAAAAAKEAEEEVPKTRDDVEVSYPYTSMAISVKGAEMPTDIVNRGIRVQMVMKPAKMELGSIAWAEYDDRGTDITPSSIRTDLYNLMCYCAGPAEDGTDWNKLIHEAIRWITTQDPETGQWLYGIALDIEDAPRISNRLRDIATTLLPVAMAAETDRDVMQLIIEAEDVHRESTELSMEAQVFKTLVDCVKAEALTEIVPTELDRYASKEGWIGRAELIRAASKVTTRDVAEALNRRLHEEGELDQYSTVLTRTVTYTLKSLGIPYLMGRGSGGRQSTINPSADGFPELFAQHLAQYDPENLPVFGDFLHRVNRNGRTG